MMKKQLLVIASILVLVIYFSSGCKKEEDTNNEFRVQIDSLKMPDTITFGSKLDIDFYGLIGTNDCYTFSRFNQVAPVGTDPANSMRIETFGVFNDSGNCQAGLVYMNPVTLSVTGLLKGEFILFALQPDGTVMTGTCYVKE